MNELTGAILALHAFLNRCSVENEFPFSITLTFHNRSIHRAVEFGMRSEIRDTVIDGNVHTNSLRIGAVARIAGVEIILDNNEDIEQRHRERMTALKILTSR